MCLFDFEHCKVDNDPMRGSLVFLIFLTVLSSLCPQFTMKFAPSEDSVTRSLSYEDECDEVCMHYFSRFSVASVLLLPLLTGLLFLGPFVFSRGIFPATLYLSISFPVIVGWTMLFCMPITKLCEDEGNDCCGCFDDDADYNTANRKRKADGEDDHQNRVYNASEDV
jgi:hypothetical protein